LVALRGLLFASEPAPLSFNRDIRPILADKCLHCHGPDEQARQADLRLDDPQSATQPREDRRVLVAGRPEESELYRRISTSDESVRMPPADQPRQLTSREIEVLRRWIAEGAKYEPHWSFIPPERPAVPDTADRGWSRNPLDPFVLSRLERELVAPSLEAAREALIRRASLDLTGLPPEVEDVDEFAAESSPAAYEKVVDRLLASPHHGERMAQVWLDAARFADSGGYQGDILRTMWPWRDWVIAAYNAGLRFDQFTIEQLAGDLLPNPAQPQLVATGFNRNHRINDEDGIILEEFRVEYVADRVETTATVWLGLTIGCARCHDHKYDPLTQREYYGLFAYFNSIAEEGRGHGNAAPVIPVLPPAYESIQRRLESAANGGPALADDERQKLLEERNRLHEQAPVAMVMREREQPRDTFVLVRGAYDRHGEKVSAGVPAALAPPLGDAPPNRLALASWLLDGRNPLTARVAVNRFWQTYFGRGLVETPEDFGTQGSPPTHPELLDWLAVEFREGSVSGGPGAWDVKRFQRLIVTSATYRQSSAVPRDGYLRDPENRLLGRGSRYRLPAEAIRDQALAASGLLDRRIGGPSVRPYQPAGIWEELASAHPTYEQSHGRDLYRRSLYTFVRRTIPPPALSALDMPNRETCSVRRPRTSTPLQALVLMNDPTFVEAARATGERVLREAGPDAADRLRHLFRLVLARPPSGRELGVLSELHAQLRERYRADPASAEPFVRVGESVVGEDIDLVELAAYAAAAGSLFNLDEALTRE
jgi:hypothetical protein